MASLPAEKAVVADLKLSPIKAHTQLGRRAGAHKKHPPPQGHHRSLGISLREGPTGGGGLMSEVPLYSPSLIHH